MGVYIQGDNGESADYGSAGALDYWRAKAEKENRPLLKAFFTSWHVRAEGVDALLKEMYAVGIDDIYTSPLWALKGDLTITTELDEEHAAAIADDDDDE